MLLGGSSIYDGSLFASMTAWANLRYPLEARGYDEAVVEERAWQRMVEFELTEVAHQVPSTLSAGTRRRLALAKSFVDDPPLLVLDDPGAAMDVVNRRAIVESIHRARAATDATMILTCHDIEMARALGDDLVVILAGRVVARGPVSELLDGIVDADTWDDGSPSARRSRRPTTTAAARWTGWRTPGGRRPRGTGRSISSSV